MDFWRIVAILKKRKWFILLAGLAGGVLALAVTQAIGPRWVATVRFIATPTSPALSADGSKNPGDSLARPPLHLKGEGDAQAEMYESQVKSRDVLEPALHSLALQHRWAGVINPNDIQVVADAPGYFELQ